MALLDGQTAVITGGSSGIGRGIAREFADHGVHAVVIADIQEEPKEGGSPTHEQIEQETDTQSTFVNCDVTNRADLETAVDTADEFGGINVMVNNAGIWHPDDFLEVSEDEYRQLMAVNLEGAYFGSQIAVQRMVEHDGGSIINISSIAGIFGNGN